MQFSGARVVIDEQAYANNVQVLRRLLSPQTRLLLAVKGNAYGHGLVPLSRVAVQSGADILGIVENAEIEALRNAGLTCPLMRLRVATNEETAEAAPYNVEETVGTWADAQAISALGERLRRKIPVHVEIDVGMGRTGFFPARDAALVRAVCALPGLSVRSLFAHFPCADFDLAVTQAQLSVFLQFVRRDLADVPVPAVHIANSAAALTLPSSHLDMVRIGLCSYGLRPNPKEPLPAGMKPVMAFYTQIASVREVPAGTTLGYGMTYTCPAPARIATLPIGYADGFWRRYAQSGAHVLVDGVRCPILGRVSMNMVTVDVSLVPAAVAGTDVVILGQAGAERITAEDLATWAGTISYEVCCALGGSF